MTTNLTKANHQVGARAGPRTRQGQITCQPKMVSDGKKRLNHLYQLILEMARQTNLSTLSREE